MSRVANIHVDETKDGDPIKIRRLSGAAFDAIGSMIDDAVTEDRIKEIIIVAGTHEMTEDIPVEQIQVDFELLLRKAKAVTSEITVSSVLPVIRDNAIKLGRLKPGVHTNDFATIHGLRALKLGHASLATVFRPGRLALQPIRRENLESPVLRYQPITTAVVTDACLNTRWHHGAYTSAASRESLGMDRVVTVYVA